MPHICMDEIMAFMMVMPFVGYAIMKVKMLWQRCSKR